MNILLFQPDVYYSKYNCSGKTLDEWYSYGERHEFIGVFCVVVGCALQVIYFPFICTMLLPQFIENSCYKLMFVLGISDFITIYAHIISGAVYCTHPKIMYAIGMPGYASWCSSCMTVVILTCNRCVDIYYPNMARVLFKGYRTWLWSFIPIGLFIRQKQFPRTSCPSANYGSVSFEEPFLGAREMSIGIPSLVTIILLVIFEPPVIFHSRYTAFFFNPFFGMNDLPQSQDPWYHSILHVTINIITMAVLCVGNTILCYYVISKARRVSNSFKLKRQFLTQVCAISMLTLVCASIYVYMQFFYTPKWLILLASITFLFNSAVLLGIVAITYLFVNQTLRRAAYDLFVRRLLGLGGPAGDSTIAERSVGKVGGRQSASENGFGPSSSEILSKY